MRLLPLLLLLAPLALTKGCGEARSTARSAPEAPLRFSDVASAMRLDYRYSPGDSPPLNIREITMGAGAAFLDYDNDGWLDILCVSLPRPALYRSDRGRGFVNVTARAGIARREARWNGCATGDYDNDGHVDLFLTAYNETALFHNNGDGTFTDVTDAAGVQVRRWATSAAFADVNRDGLLDLYVGCYVRFAPGMPEYMTVRGVRLPLSPLAYDAQKGMLFLNRGGGRFHEATREAGLDDCHGKTLGVAFADADGDGDEDLYLANDEEPQDFFQNDGKGRFRNIAMENGTAFSGEGGRQGGMGLDFGDYDRDGHLDLFVATFADEPKSLYRNTGTGLYQHAGPQAGIDQATRAWVGFGSKFLDLDHDAWLDLVIVNGHVRDLVQQVDPENSYPQKSQLFLNTGGGRFRDASDGVGPDFRKPIVGRALAAGDFDNDGDLDLLAADLEGPPLLLRNDGGNQAGNWLMLDLQGTRSNRMAIGARVELRTGSARQIREVRTDGSYLAAHDPRVHFGLDQAARVDEIRIRWPSGIRQTLTNVAANQVLRVREGISERPVNADERK
jgi:enediyne biosynthesis protein E4